MSRIYSTDELDRIASIRARYETVKRVLKDGGPISRKETEAAAVAAKHLALTDVPYLLNLLENNPTL